MLYMHVHYHIGTPLIFIKHTIFMTCFKTNVFPLLAKECTYYISVHDMAECMYCLSVYTCTCVLSSEYSIIGMC